MDSSLWVISLLTVLLVVTGFARFFKAMLYPDTTAHDVAVCKERLREMDYRLGDVLRELKEIRLLLENRRPPHAATTVQAAPAEERITTPEARP